MSETLLRTEPVAEAPFTGNQVVIALAPSMRRYSLRARSAEELTRVLGFTVPAAIGTTANGIACLGPDEWLLRTRENTQPISGPGAAKVAITDICDRNVGFTLEGPRAIAVLSAGCPLDLARWPVGRASRTVFETVEMIIEREAADRFHVEVWRSFAPWLWLALTSAGSE